MRTIYAEIADSYDDGGGLILPAWSAAVPAPDACVWLLRDAVVQHHSPADFRMTRANAN
jgi:hypothetical protein